MYVCMYEVNVFVYMRVYMFVCASAYGGFVLSAHAYEHDNMYTWS